jgi:hypothetical protein
MSLIKLSQIIFSKQNIFNIIFLIFLFPFYLYFIQNNQPFFSVFGILGFLILLFYLIVLYRYKIRFYQIPLHFIIASILFMQVIKGDTVPLALIVSVLGLSLFFVQDIISNEEYKSSEFMRQIVLSGIIFMSFSTYAFLFGAIFISSLSPVLLSFLAFIANINIITYTLWMYGVDKKYYIPISLIASFIIVQLFLGIRILPFTHLTQSILLTTYLLFSISILRDVFLQKLNLKKLLSVLLLTWILFGFLIFTSLI